MTKVFAYGQKTAGSHSQIVSYRVQKGNGAGRLWHFLHTPCIVCTVGSASPPTKICPKCHREVSSR